MLPMPEAKAGENTGGADIPGIRNYKSARAVVKSPEAGCLFVLGNAHGKLCRDEISTMLLLEQGMQCRVRANVE